MEVFGLRYLVGQGWSEPLPNLDSPRTVVFVFGAPLFETSSEPIGELVARFPQSKILGCSSAGEIFGGVVRDKSLAVAICRFASTDLRLVTESIAGADQSAAVGARLASKLKDPKLAGVIVLSEGLSVNGTSLVQGINAGLGAQVIVTGGLAGDGSNFKRTWVIAEGKPQSGKVAALGFYGSKIRFGHGSQGGWDIFGPERRVTKSEGNVLFELDGQPALDLYKSYLGEKASGLPASGLLFPLQIRVGPGDDKRLVRTILAVDEAKRSLIFAGDIPQGSLAQLMRANFDRLIDGATNAATQAASAGDGPTLAIAISCVGRRLVLGERIEEEVEATLERLPPKTVQVGFYSYGELSPFVKGGACELHNQTMTLTTIGEAA